MTYELLRDYQEARKTIDRLIALEPNDTDHRARRAFIDFAERADTRPAGFWTRFLGMTRCRIVSVSTERDAVAADRALAELGAGARILLMQEVSVVSDLAGIILRVWWLG